MKEKLEPINITVPLKNFLTGKNIEFKRKYGKFFSTTSTLLSYLNSSEDFVRDYAKYLGENNENRLG